jgi:hypothetical protein
MGIRWIDHDEEEMNDFIEPPVWDGTIPDGEECYQANGLIPNIGAPNESLRQPECSDKLVIGLGLHEFDDQNDRFFRGIVYFCEACKNAVDEHNDLTAHFSWSKRYFPKKDSSQE